MTELIRKLTTKAKNKNIDSFSTGDTVNVYVKIKEGDKERAQQYRGIVTKIQGEGSSKSFTVRKISSGVGVERIFPFASPALERVEIISHGKVRRSRLFYLRGLSGKAASVQSELVSASSKEEAAKA